MTKPIPLHRLYTNCNNESIRYFQLPVNVLLPKCVPGVTLHYLNVFGPTIAAYIKGENMARTEVLLTPREAAAEIGVSYATIKQWILAGKLSTTKTPGGHHRIPQRALTPLMKSTPGKPSIQSRERFRTVSGRNQLVGKIMEVKISGLLAKVVLSIGDQQITSIITADAAREMQLRRGQTAAALMKSTEVMIVRV